MTLFTSYIGIDYSGAKTTVSGNKGLQVFETAIDSDPFRVKSPAGKKWNWTRKEIAHWCLEQFKSGDPAEEGTSMLLCFTIPSLPVSFYPAAYNSSCLMFSLKPPR